MCLISLSPRLFRVVISCASTSLLKEVCPVQSNYGRLIHDADKPSGREMEGCSLDTRVLWSQWSYLLVKDKGLYFTFRQRFPDSLVLPRPCVVQIVGQLHPSLGCHGAPKIAQAARQCYWLPNLRDVRMPTERAKSSNHQLKALLQPMIGVFPNETFDIGLIGPLP